MLWGYFQKLVIADQAALAVNTVFGDYAVYGGVERLLAAVLYALQIYADFAGYTAIARGAAQVLGFHLAENFRQPYLAQSVREFWGRGTSRCRTGCGIYLHPAGRQPPRGAAPVSQPVRHLPAQRAVARRGVALCRLGRAARGVPDRRGRHGRAAAALQSRAGVPGAVGAAGVHLCAGDGGLGVFPRRFGAAGSIVSGRHRGLVRPLGADRRHAADAGPGRLGAGLCCSAPRRCCWRSTACTRGACACARRWHASRLFTGGSSTMRRWQRCLCSGSGGRGMTRLPSSISSFKGGPG